MAASNSREYFYTSAREAVAHPTGTKEKVNCLQSHARQIQVCSAAKAERIAKETVLCALRLRAKSEGKKVNGGTENIAGSKRCRDVQWLWTTLNKMAEEFAVLIDEDLQWLNHPGAEREVLVEMIYTHLLCIRATFTIFVGDD